MRILTARWPGLSLCNEQLVASPWSGELAKGPSSLLPPPSLLPYSANVKLTARLSALAVRKSDTAGHRQSMYWYKIFLKLSIYVLQQIHIKVL